MDSNVHWTPWESWPSTYSERTWRSVRGGHVHQMLLLGIGFLGRHLNNAYSSVPGGVGSRPASVALNTSASGVCV
jgi:5-methylcytosine-specific restriction endonuclease McrA